MDKPELPSPLWMPYPSVEENKRLQLLFELLLSAHSDVVDMWSAISLAEHVFQIHDSLLFEITNRTPQREAAKARFVDTQAWPKFAAHAAINAIFQFRETLQGIIEWSEGGEVAHLLEPDFAARDLDRFEKTFPHWKATRHAAAHTAEIRRKAQDNYFTAALSRGRIGQTRGSKLLMQDCMEGRTFITTRKGALLKFDVTWESYLKLLAIYQSLLKGIGTSSYL